MAKRFMSIWFPYLKTDRACKKRPELHTKPVVYSILEHGRKIITAANHIALQQNILPGTTLADARAVLPEIANIDDVPGSELKLLRNIGEWCIRFSPFVAIDLNDGLILDTTGCTHLWKGEPKYLNEISDRLKFLGYSTKIAIADNPAAARAISRFSIQNQIIEPGKHKQSLLELPPQALGFDKLIIDRMIKLGFHQIGQFIDLQPSVLRRRFGDDSVQKIFYAIGIEEEILIPIKIQQTYQERLPCPETVRTGKAIEIAIKNLLEKLCLRLRNEGKGMRKAILECYRIDGKIISIECGTNRATNQVKHLFKLFELKISSIAPGLGIELFVMTAQSIELVDQKQEELWNSEPDLNDLEVAELIDRLEGKLGKRSISRYLPSEHYWPERSYQQATSLNEQTQVGWRKDCIRPTKLLQKPHPIEVSAPIPDYPPMLFNYQGKTHHIIKADGPERIEQEWWLQTGEHRDYYQVEDADGQRYWLFRSGHYTGEFREQWYLHGFFA